MQELKKLMDNAGQILDPLEKSIVTLAILTEALSGQVKPVLVGGMAVAFYTLGGYTTKDIDVVMPTIPAVDAVMEELGFAKEGRYWIRTDNDVAVEAPSSSLHGDWEHVVEVDAAGLKAYVLGVEDLVLDRLNAAVHWESQEDLRWARRLVDVHGADLDWDYLRARALAENVASALAEIERSDEPD